MRANYTDKAIGKYGFEKIFLATDSGTQLFFKKRYGDNFDLQVLCLVHHDHGRFVSEMVAMQVMLDGVQHPLLVVGEVELELDAFVI